jgi:hypothetical protein
LLNHNHTGAHCIPMHIALVAAHVLVDRSKLLFIQNLRKSTTSEDTGVSPSITTPV